MKYHTSELFTSTNMKSGRVTYYAVVCGAPRRVSKAEYDKRYQSADGLDCIYTRTVRGQRRQYCTVRYEVKE